ncbi:MAG: hypothetical protein ACTHU0_21595 [Kofleriaceae bacterium]
MKTTFPMDMDLTDAEADALAGLPADSATARFNVEADVSRDGVLVERVLFAGQEVRFPRVLARAEAVLIQRVQEAA